MRVEALASKVLAYVEKTYASTRSAIESLGVREHRGKILSLVLGVLRNYKLLQEALKYCGYRGRVRGGVKGWLPLVLAYKLLFSDVKGIPSDYMLILDRHVAECLKIIDPSEVYNRFSGDLKLSVKYSIPLWVIRYLKKLSIPYGGLEKLLDAFQKPTPVWIRFNRARIKLREAVNKLLAMGVIAEPDLILDDVLEVKHTVSGALSRLDPSLFYVQDRFSTLIAHVARLAPPMVIDLMSAPGSKLGHVYWRSNYTYSIGLDISVNRCLTEHKLLSRQQVWIVDIVNADARLPPLARVPKASLILVDPDCSSMGRLGHSPETRLFLEATGPSIVHRASRLQRKVLLKAISIASEDTIIIYSTCTLTLEENENVVAKALETGRVEVEEAYPWIGVEGGIRGVQRVYPHISRCVGGFIARIRVSKA